MQTCIFFIIIYIVICALGFIITFYAFGTAFIEEVKRKLRTSNETYKLNKNHEQIYDEIIDIVRYTSEIKELQIMNPFQFS